MLLITTDKKIISGVIFLGSDEKIKLAWHTKPGLWCKVKQFIPIFKGSN